MHCAVGQRNSGGQGRGYDLFSIAGEDPAAKLFFAGMRFTIAGLLVLALVLVRRETPLFPKKTHGGGFLCCRGRRR